MLSLLSRSRRSFTIVLLAAAVGITRPALAQGQEVLNNASIITLVSAKVPEAAILDKIDVSRTTFDMSVTGIVALSRAGVPEGIMSAMQESAARGGAPRGGVAREVRFALPTDYGVYAIVDSTLRPLLTSELQRYTRTDYRTKQEVEFLALAPRDIMRTYLVEQGASLLVYDPDLKNLRGIELRQLDWTDQDTPVEGYKKLVPTRLSPVAENPAMVRIIIDGNLRPGGYALHFPARENHFFPFLFGRGSTTIPDLEEAGEREARWATARTLTLATTPAAALNAARQALREEGFRIGGSGEADSAMVTRWNFKSFGLLGVGGKRRYQVTVRATAVDSASTKVQIIALAFGSGMPGVALAEGNTSRLPQLEEPEAERDMMETVAKGIRTRVRGGH